MSYVKQIDINHIITFREECDYLQCRLEYLNQYGKHSNFSFSFFIEQLFRNLNPERIEDIYYIDSNNLTNNPDLSVDSFDINQIAYSFGSSVSSSSEALYNSSYNAEWIEEENNQFQISSNMFLGDQEITLTEGPTGYADTCEEIKALEKKKKKKIEKISRFEMLDLED
ncbi:MAG: hypothetical protein J7L15_05890 [Clostridiales bacterium]|nr:hypothetical protein [Clostridiales bacterium]